MRVEYSSVSFRAVRSCSADAGASPSPSLRAAPSWSIDNLSIVASVRNNTLYRRLNPAYTSLLHLLGFCNKVIKTYLAPARTAGAALPEVRGESRAGHDRSSMPRIL